MPACSLAFWNFEGSLWGKCLWFTLYLPATSPKWRVWNMLEVTTHKLDVWWAEHETGKKWKISKFYLCWSAFDCNSLKTSRYRKAAGGDMDKKITGRKLHQNQFIARETVVYIPATNSGPLEMSEALVSGHIPSSWQILIITLSLYYLDL